MRKLVVETIAHRGTMRPLMEGTSDEASNKSWCGSRAAGSIHGRCFARSQREILLWGPAIGVSRIAELSDKIINNPRAR